MRNEFDKCYNSCRDVGLKGKDKNMANRSKNDVIKALRICSGVIEALCRECPYNNIEIESDTEYSCYDNVMQDAAEYLDK